jgi:hypothetical protein
MLAQHYPRVRLGTFYVLQQTLGKPRPYRLPKRFAAAGAEIYACIAKLRVADIVSREKK